MGGRVARVDRIRGRVVHLRAPGHAGGRGEAAPIVPLERGLALDRVVPHGEWIEGQALVGILLGRETIGAKAERGRVPLAEPLRDLLPAELLALEIGRDHDTADAVGAAPHVGEAAPRHHGHAAIGVDPERVGAEDDLLDARPGRVRRRDAEDLRADGRQARLEPRVLWVQVLEHDAACRGGAGRSAGRREPR